MTESDVVLFIFPRGDVHVLVKKTIKIPHLVGNGCYNKSESSLVVTKSLQENKTERVFNLSLIIGTGAIMNDINPGDKTDYNSDNETIL